VVRGVRVGQPGVTVVTTMLTDQWAVSTSTLRLSITLAPPTETACHGTPPLANHYSDTLQTGVKPPLCYTTSREKFVRDDCSLHRFHYYPLSLSPCMHCSSVVSGQLVIMRNCEASKRNTRSIDPLFQFADRQHSVMSTFEHLLLLLICFRRWQSSDRKALPKLITYRRRL